MATSPVFFHGGVAGKRRGDVLIPSPPHKVCGCPICEARSDGRSMTVGEYRRWLARFGERARPVLNQLAGAADWEPIDPPRREQAVYVTTNRDYARWYAARSRGGLYLVEPIGPIVPSVEDRVPSWTCQSARIVRVVEPRVRLTRKDRRAMMRVWKAADAKYERKRQK